MDPNECLAIIREAIKRANDSISKGDYRLNAMIAIENFEALDEWLSKGGFKPRDWA